MTTCTLQYSLVARAAEPAGQPPGVSPPTPAQAAAPGQAQATKPANPPAQLQAPAPAAQPPASGQRAAPVATFDVLEYQIEGNTLLPAIAIEQAVTPYLGEKKTIKDVEAARTELERAYHDRGYKTVLVNIPPQKVAAGTVRLVVTEAAVGKLKITGSKYHSLQVIRDKVAQLNPDTVPNFEEVQKELGEVNRSADLHVAPILRASETPGRVDVELSVKDSLPLHALVEVDNRYSANTTHLRTTGELRYDNLFQSDQSLSLQYQIAPERTSDAKIASLSYVIPFSNHTAWALYAIHSDSNVAAVGNLDVIGKGNIFGVRFIAPLPTPSRDFYHSFTAGVDYKDFGQSVLLQGSTSTIESPVKYPPFTLQYSGTWLGPLLEPGAHPPATAIGRSATNLQLGLSFLISGLGTDWRQFANKRAGASPSYMVLHPTLSRDQVLPWNWSLVGVLDGQIASGPLINNEQYSGGGADSVRGYVEAERLADHAARGSLELRTPQALAGQRFPHIEQSYAFLFADGAWMRIIQPLPGQQESFTLISAGLGIKLKAAGFTLAADGAHIFKSGAVTPAGRNRVLFSVSYTY